MLFRHVYDDVLAQAAYLIACQESGEAIVVDPERDIDRYRTLAERHRVRITAVAETHIHADFLSGTKQLAEATGATAFLSGAGSDAWRYRWPDAGGVAVKRLQHGDTFHIGRVRFDTVHTPGHTPEHLSFLVTDTARSAGAPLGVLTGDFVFVGDVGRPDLLDSATGASGTTDPAARALAQSAARFLDWEDYVQVWPGHGAGSACGKALGAVPQSTVGYERRHNEALRRVPDVDAFVAHIVAGQPAPPRYFGRVKVQNRDAPPRLDRLPAPAWITPGVWPEDAVVVDARSVEAFTRAHLPGSLSAPLGASFAAIAGSYVEPEDPIVLVAEPDSLDTAVRVLARIGLDRVVGAVPAGDVETNGSEPFPTFHGADLAADRTPPVLLDVRNADEHALGALPGSMHVPYTQLADALERVPRDRDVCVYCQAGGRSLAAASYLRRHGVRAANLDGGLDALVTS